jgi:hypothetical protein
MTDIQVNTKKIKEEYENKKGKKKTRTIREKYQERINYFYRKNHL